MAYFIRREITYRDGQHSVTFWRGSSEPAMWVYHHSDAAHFINITTARATFKDATGYLPGEHPQEMGLVSVVGGPT